MKDTSLNLISEYQNSEYMTTIFSGPPGGNGFLLTPFRIRDKFLSVVEKKEQPER